MMTEKFEHSCCQHCILDIDYSKLARILYEEYNDEVAGSYWSPVEEAFWDAMARRVVGRCQRICSRS